MSLPSNSKFEALSHLILLLPSWLSVFIVFSFCLVSGSSVGTAKPGQTVHPSTDVPLLSCRRITYPGHCCVLSLFAGSCITQAVTIHWGQALGILREVFCFWRGTMSKLRSQLIITLCCSAHFFPLCQNFCCVNSLPGVFSPSFLGFCIPTPRIS